MNELKRQTELQDIAAKYSSGQAPLPPGSQVENPTMSTPEAGSGMQPISQTLGLGANEQKVTLPGNSGSFTALKPEEFAAQQANLDKIRQAPAREAAVKLEELKAHNEMMLRLAQDADMLKRVQIQQDSATDRTKLSHAADIYRIDKNYQGRVEAAILAAGKLTGAEKTNADNTKDMLDAVKNAMSILGDPKDPKSKWAKYFTGSVFDEVGRNNPKIADVVKIGKMPDELTDVNSALTQLDQTLGEKGKSNPIVAQALQRGASGMRSQSATDAYNNLNALRFELEQQMMNIGTARSFSLNTFVNPPDKSSDTHSYYDKKGNRIK